MVEIVVEVVSIGDKVKVFGDLWDVWLWIDVEEEESEVVHDGDRRLSAVGCGGERRERDLLVLDRGGDFERSWIGVDGIEDRGVGRSGRFHGSGFRSWWRFRLWW